MIEEDRSAIGGVEDAIREQTKAIQALECELLVISKAIISLCQVADEACDAVSSIAVSMSNAQAGSQ